MLPDFPKIKRKWSDMFVRMLRKRIHQGSFLSQIRTTRHFEGDRQRVTDVTGDTEESDYETFSEALEVNRQDLIDRGPIAYMASLEKIAKEFESQQSKMIFERVNKVTAKTGNMVNAGGQDINPDLILQVLETIEIDFNEAGQPRLPTLVASPEQIQRLKEKMPEWEKDESYKRKFDELIKRKRQEWNDRESHRKLVD